MICDDSGGALEESNFEIPERLGREATLPAGLESIHSGDHGNDVWSSPDMST
jgi:hypothetical protein